MRSAAQGRDYSLLIYIIYIIFTPKAPSQDKESITAAHGKRLMPALKKRSQITQVRRRSET